MKNQGKHWANHELLKRNKAEWGIRRAREGYIRENELRRGDLVVLFGMGLSKCRVALHGEETRHLNVTVCLQSIDALAEFPFQAS